MKNRILFSAWLFLISLFLNSTLLAQESKGAKKALDAFVNATTKSANLSEPVPGAEITVEQVPGPTIVKTCKTTKDGEFAISISNIDEFQGKDTKEIRFLITFKQVDKTKFKTAETKIPLTLEKSDGPFYELVVMYDKESNKVVIERNKHTKDSQGVRREKGDASKVGDKYMGQVAHF